MKRALRFAARTLGTLPFVLLATTLFASAGIQVNKAFSPNSIALGGTSQVTVTLQNDSTASAATITAFSDDIGTTMAGHAQLLSSPSPSTTCVGGTPSIAGQVLSMNNGQIPIAPSSSVLGSCTITFSVAGAVTGNGFNTIAAANVVTSLGSPTADVTQTLTIQSANVTGTATSPGSVQIGDTSTMTYVLTNPSAVALTNAAFAINATATASFTVSGYTTSCGGTASLPAAGTAGSTGFSGLTIPASGTCTLTLTVTTPSVTTVNFALAAGGITDTQGATNTLGISGQSKFVNGQPTVTKSFSPTAIVPGGTATLTINVQNVLTDKPLTNAAFNDVLPLTLTLASTPTTNAFCGTPTIGGNGTGTLAFSGGTISASHTCTITATVSMPGSQPAGQLTNTIPATGTNSFTSTEVNGSAAAASATLTATGTGGGISTSIAALPTSAALNAPIKITLGFTSLAGGAFSGGTFTHNVPQTAVAMVALTDAGHLPTFTNCGSASPAVAFGGTGGNTTVTGSNLAIAAGTTCSVSFYEAFTTAQSVSRVDSEQLVAGNVSFTGTSGAVSPGSTVSTNVTELPTLSITNYVASNSGPLNQALTVQATINDASGASDTNGVAVINLTAGKVALSATPNFTFSGCPSGLSAAGISIAGNREQFTVTIGSINATCTIGYDVIDEAGALGSFTPANPTYSSTLTGGVALASTGQNSVTFSSTTINVTKAFGPNQIQSGGNSTVSVDLTAPQAGSLARTQVNGVAFSDALPANMTFSPTPNVAFTGCQQTGQPVPAFTITGTTISFTNISLVTLGTTQTTCIAQFDVTSSVVGAPLNQIAVGAITSTSGISNTQAALASLTVNAGLGIAKTFLNATFQIGGTDYVRFLVTNSASSSALSGGTLVDAMPASLALASTTLGSIQAGDPALCGGSVAGPVGTGTLNLSGLAVAGKVGSVPGQCVVYVALGASAGAAPGSVANTVAVGNLNVGGFSNQTAATGNVTLTAPPGPTLAKTFTPAIVAPHGTSVLSISIANTASGAAALSGMTLTDTLPTGLTLAAVPNAATTCGAGTLTAVAGAASVALTAGSVAANSSCTITVGVTGTIAGSYANTIAANALSTTQGATNAALATANLSIASSAVSKAFAPAAIAAGGNSLLTITIPSGGVALSGIALGDTLPPGVTIAAAPAAATTCGAGTVTASAGATSVALAGGTLGANATCTVSVNVTGTVAATYTNTIAANALTTTQTVSNPNAATASLTIVPAGTTLSKTFAPATIAAGATSVLTITIPNTAAGAVALSGMSLTDTLPSGVTIAATPSAATTCPAGTVTAAAGGTSVALAGGTLAANATCTIAVSVTGTVAASYTNTIAANALTTTQGVTNSTLATANLTITPAGIALSKAFLPATITAGGTSVLTITIPNTAAGAVALSGMSLTDTLPSGVTLAATPNAATTCPAGIVTAAAGGTSLALAGGTLAANATCTIIVSVTGSAAATYTNTIAASALTTAQGRTNPAVASANLTIGPTGIVVTKAFAPAAIAIGSTSLLTIAISNTAAGSVALSNMALTDTLPAGVALAAAPNATTTCPSGTVTAASGGSSVALAAGTLAPGATCTIGVTVTGTAAGAHTNTIASNALTTLQGLTNPTPATAVLTVSTASLPTIALAFGPPSIGIGGISTLTVTIADTGTNAVALTNLSFVDTLLAGVKIAQVPNATTTCSGVASGSAGGAMLALTGGSLAAGATCTVSIDVTSSSAGPYANTIPANALSDTQALSNAAPATSTLTVTAAPAVSLTQTFSPATIAAGATSVLTLTFGNGAAGAVPLTGIALTDSLPAGVVLAAAPNASTTCPLGTATANAAAATFAVSGATLAANATCTLVVTVTGNTAGAYANSIAAGALSSVQGATNAATQATLTVTAVTTLTLTKVFSPATIVSGGTSTLTATIANTSQGAIPLTSLALTDALPAGVVLAAVPSAVTSCGAGSVAASAGAATFALTGGTLAAGATCTVSVSVTSGVLGTHVDASASGAVTDAQNVSNPLGANASLAVSAAPALAIAQSFTTPAIAAGATSVLTLTLGSSQNGVRLTGVALSDALPAGVVLAGTPNASTTCNGGIVTAIAGAASFALSAGTLGPNATCTITVTVSASAAGSYTNALPAGALTSAQGVSNAASQATLTVTGAPSLQVTKTSNVAGAGVTAGETLAYTIAIRNAGTSAETNARITDVLTNASLVPGSVRVDGAAAADAVVISGAAFGSIPAGTTATIAYSVIVHANVAGGAHVTNGATVAGDQPCAGAGCSATALPDVVQTPPRLQVTLLIDGRVSETVTLGQVVTYSATIENVGGTGAQNVVLGDTLPAGVTPIAGSVTLPAGVRIESVDRVTPALGGASGTSVDGQTVDATLGVIAAGASKEVLFRAKITQPIPKVAANVVTVGATGIPSTVTSNVVVATMVRAVLTVTKIASAVVVQTGDRVNYAVQIAAPTGATFGKTTIVDQLPNYLSFAPGSARINGVASNPTVAGNTLTWTLPALGAPVTLTYAAAIAAGAQANATLDNVVGVTAASLGGGPSGSGSASATIQVAASTFGSCYPITGRVYDDADGTGRFDKGDAGLAGVSIILDDGESVVTDAFGRYSFPCVRQGMHALRLDEQTLPAGSAPYADRAIDSERSTHRLVHGIFDDTIIRDINFAIARRGS